MDTIVMNKVHAHAQFVDKYLAEQKLPYDRVVTCLIGSQNYGLDTLNSDVDTISLCIPDFETCAKGEEHISTTLIMSDGSHATVRDIRDWVLNGLKKQPLHFYEALFTEYTDKVSAWEHYWDKLVHLKSLLLYYNPEKFLSTLAYQALPYWKRNEKNGYTGKATAMLCYLVEFMKEYTNTFNRGLNTFFIAPNYCKALKQGEYNLIDMKEYAQKSNAYIQSWLDTHITLAPKYTDIVDHSINQWFKQIVYRTAEYCNEYLGVKYY